MRLLEEQVPVTGMRCWGDGASFAAGSLAGIGARKSRIKVNSNKELMKIRRVVECV